MNKRIIKVIIVSNLLFGYLMSMEQQPRDPNWRCPKHTKSQEELFHLGLLEAAVGTSLAILAVTDDIIRFTSARNETKSVVGVEAVDSSAARELLETNQRRRPNFGKLYALSFSVCLLTDSCHTVWKTLRYDEYTDQRHALYKCLTDHR